MERRKTILPILLGIATLLVAVIGATYAYFSVNITNTDRTSTTTQTADTVGSVALSNPTNALHLTLEASNMSSANQNTKYYATDVVNKNYDTEAEKIARPVALATVTGGTQDTKYTCTFTLNVNLSGDMASVLSEGDAKIIFSGALTETSDLSNVAGTRTVTMSNLSGTTTTEDVKVIVVFNNKTTTQNTLAGKTLTISLSNSNFKCQIQENIPVASPTVAYWTYEGEYVNSANANKVSDYRNLNVYRRLDGGGYYVYPTSSASTCESDNGGVPCESLVQPYFIKETITPNTVATEDVYAYQEYVDGELDYTDPVPYTLSTCQDKEWGDPENNSEYGICTKIVNANETYTKLENETCVNINGTVVCIKPNDWGNVETIYKEAFENAGWQCDKTADNMRCALDNLNSLSLHCNMYDSGGAYCGIISEGLCDVSTDGYAYCHD